MFLINNEPWHLEFVDSHDPILLNPDGNYTVGVTIPEYRTIFIADNISGDYLHHVLCHELFHAEMVSRGVFVPEYIEEALCDIAADYSLETIDMTNDIHNNLCRYYGKC